MSFLKGIFGNSDAQTDSQDGMVLYHFMSCPFCYKVRTAIDQLELNIELRDIHKSSDFHKELAEGGGKTTVPCLRIEKDGKTQWMYESDDIIAYLHKNFG